jgi:hypothetical protein
MENKSSISEEMVIRAPAFARLVKHIRDFKKSSSMFDAIAINTSDEENDELNEIFKAMLEEANVYHKFPTNNMVKLSRLFMKVIRFYENEGSLHNKIIMCYAMQRGFASWVKSETIYEKTQRAEEVMQLNHGFYDLSKKISGLVVDVRAEITTADADHFSPDSEFVRLTVTYIA